jgi:guanylate kinase
MRGNLIIVTAPSGAGKTTLVARMLERVGGIRPSISFTARPVRPGEKNGVAYHFVSRAEFQTMIDRGEFLEWAEVHGNPYGTSLKAVEDGLNAGLDVVTTIDVQGAERARMIYPDAVSVFILPPTLEALQSRLEARGSDDDGSRRLRLENARHELSHFPRFDYIVINDDLERATCELSAIVRAERCRTRRRSEFAEELFREITD